MCVYVSVCVCVRAGACANLEAEESGHAERGGGALRHTHLAAARRRLRLCVRFDLVRVAARRALRRALRHSRVRLVEIQLEV